MKINKSRVKEAALTARKLFFELKRDKEALSALRILVFGILTIFLIVFFTEQFLLEPRKKEVKKLRALCAQLEKEASFSLPEASFLALEKNKSKLEKEISILETKKHFLTLDNKGARDPDRFRRIVLGLLGNGPSALSSGLVKAVTVIEKDNNSENADMTLVNGELPFFDLYHYLDYLEHRIEVATMDKLTIKRRGCSKTESKKTKDALLCFQLTVGRTTNGGS